MRIIHAPVYVEIMRRLLPVIRQQEAFSVTPFGPLCDHFSFYWNRGTIVYSVDDFGEPHGVCAIKLFRSLGQFLEPFVHDPCGEFVMIDLLVADTPNVMAQLWENLVNRWGSQKVVMWDRGIRTENGAPHMMAWPTFLKLTRRLTYNLIGHV